MYGCTPASVCVRRCWEDKPSELEKDRAIRTFVFVSPVLMTSAAQAPISVSRVRGGGDVSNPDLQVKKTIAAGY